MRVIVYNQTRFSRVRCWLTRITVADGLSTDRLDKGWPCYGCGVKKERWKNASFRPNGATCEQLLPPSRGGDERGSRHSQTCRHQDGRQVVDEETGTVPAEGTAPAQGANGEEYHGATRPSC